MSATDYYAVGIITGLMALIVLGIWANLRPQMPAPPSSTTTKDHS